MEQPDTDQAEAEFITRVLDTLFREDHLGMLSRGRLTAAPVDSPGEQWWQAPLPGNRAVYFPVRHNGFLADYTLVGPRVVIDDGDACDTKSTVDDILAALAPRDDAEAESGWEAFTSECRQTLSVIREHVVAGPALHDRLADRNSSGFSGMLHFEALAALRDHPVHPTSRCRWDMSPGQLRRFAPEYFRGFPLRWAAVPREQMRLSEAMTKELPGWWPTPSDLGFSQAEDHFILPVHPLTVERGELDAPFASLDVMPTLSTRTVAVTADPGVHLKLPMPTATLGRRNKRTIKPGTLASGDAMHRLLNEILEREPRLAARVLLADETCWADSESDLMAVLIRRFPREVAEDTLVPVAALLAHDPSEPGQRVLDHLAAQHTRHGVTTWFDSYLSALLDWHVALWLRYGIALEAHQQNITVAQTGPRVRLVYKDNDSGRIDCARLSQALGQQVDPGDFGDQRIAISDPAELADMVTTITLHLCVAALIVEEAGNDLRRRAELFSLARTRLEEAAQRWCDPSDPGSRQAAELLRTRILDADRLPIKAMVTSGTLLPKHRLGCTDINKYYLRTGPNYLKAL